MYIYNIIIFSPSLIYLISLIFINNDIYSLKKTVPDPFYYQENLAIKIIPVKYLNVAYAKNILQKLNDNISIIEDSVNNLLILKSTPGEILKYKNILLEIDKPQLQIAIETKVIKASAEFKHELGFTWKTVNNKKAGNFLPIININKFEVDLKALEQRGIAEVMNDTKILTINDKPAVISQGQEIPYQQASYRHHNSINFKKAALSLTITPKILDHNQLILQIHINNDVANLNNPFTNGVPLIETQELDTQVIVQDKQALLLGGVLSKQIGNDEKKIPFLAKMPLISVFFTNKTKLKLKNEFFIYLKASIINKITKKV